MARALLLWFVLWMTLPTSVRAVQDFRSQDQDSLQACRKIEDSLADAYDHENWAAATRTANLLYECPIERGKVHVWKLRALYRGGEHRTVLEEVNAIRSEFDDEQTPPYPQAGEVLYYGFLSAYAIGEDEIALQMVNDSWRFKDLLSDASKAEIASSRIAAALKLGEYAYALDLVDSMEGHFASVSPFQKAQYWQAEALARLYRALDGAAGDGVDYDAARIRTLLAQARSGYEQTADQKRIVYLDAAEAALLMLEGDVRRAQARIQAAIDDALAMDYAWGSAYARVFAARIDVAAEDGDAALRDLAISEASSKAARTNALAAEIEEVRVRAHVLNWRYDLAATSIWKLRGMEAPGAEHRLHVASLATVGGGGFVPWAVGLGLVSVLAFFAAARAGRVLEAYLPVPTTSRAPH